MIDLSLFRAIPEPRGCGDREPGGVYVESGVGPFGSPLEHFLLDPPQKLPEGLDLVNKPRLWQRTLPSGEPALDENEQPIYDLLIHVGAEYYPYAPDYIEETRRLGASRRLNPQLDLTLLSRESRLLLAHPKAIPDNWRDLLPPERCKKRRAWHDRITSALLSEDPLHNPRRAGPCIFKLWELIPQSVAKTVVYPTPEAIEQLPLCLREVGSTIYQYHPTGEAVTSWTCGFVLSLPITGFSLIQFSDGSVNRQAKKKLLKAQDKWGKDQRLPFYETPK
jgi:hypothetical protein